MSSQKESFANNELKLDADAMDKLVEGELLQVRETDNIIISTCVTNGVSELETSIYSRDDASIWTRSSIMLGNVIPLAVEYCGKNSLGGTLVALSGFESGDAGIELWDIDYMDQLEPLKYLGGTDQTKESESHIGPVLCLAQCPANSNIMASGGADSDIIIWDLTIGKRGLVKQRFRHHQ